MLVQKELWDPDSGWTLLRCPCLLAACCEPAAAWELSLEAGSGPSNALLAGSEPCPVISPTLQC